MAKIYRHKVTQVPLSYRALLKESLDAMVAEVECRHLSPSGVIVDFDRNVYGIVEDGERVWQDTIAIIRNNDYQQPSAAIPNMRYLGTWKFSYALFDKAATICTEPVLPLVCFGPSTKVVNGKAVTIDFCDLTVFLRPSPNDLAIWDTGRATEERIIWPDAR